MKKKIFSIILMSVNFLSGLAAFYSISRAIRIAEASTWIVPMVWMSIYMLSIFMVSVLVKNTLAAEMMVVASLFTSMIFVFNLIHLAIAVVAIFMVLGGVYSIKKDLDLNVKISLWKSLYMGKFKIIAAVAVLITSQYFFTIKSINGPVNVPRLDLSQIVEPLMTPILGIVNPEFAQASKQDLTIDQFIIQTQQDYQDANDDGSELEFIDANIPAEMPAAQKEILRQQALSKMNDAKSKLSLQNQQLILQEGRRQFSKIAGRQVEGDEKVSTVFTGMINDRINNYFQPINGNQKAGFYPLVLSLILLLTIWPLGSLASNVWFALVILFFKIFVRYGLVEIQKVTVEREMIA